MNTPVVGDTPLAPYLITDRLPLHYGARSTVSVITSVLRIAELGYRLQYVDLLTELIEGDAHARGVLGTRENAVSSRPWSLAAAGTETEQEAAKSEFIARYVERVIRRIPRWSQHVNAMLRGITYGVTAREIMWARTSTGEWYITRLHQIHSRRLGYDWDWQLCFSDYGYAAYGEPLRSYPGKFWAFEPMLSDELPTREGLGRTLAYWLGFKRFDVRDLLAYVERFGKPFPDVSWRTGDVERGANDAEIAFAKSLAKQIGTGTMGGAAHADTVSVQHLGNGGAAATGSGENTPHKYLEELCDEQISKLVLAQAYSTNKGQKTGLGSKGDIFADASFLTFVSDCNQISASIDEDIVTWIVRLNFGEDAVTRYLPHYTIHIDEEENLAALARDVVAPLKQAGLKIPSAWAYETFRIPPPKAGEELLGDGVDASPDAPVEAPDDTDDTDDSGPGDDEAVADK